MKRILLLITIGFFFSCKKDKEIQLLNQEIIGTWEFETFSGYPFTQPILPPGNGRIIVISGDGSFERKMHDTLVFKGNYTLQKKDDCYKRENNIIFSTNESSPNDYQYIEVVGGRLTLSSPNCYQDGGTAYYRRVKFN